MRKWKLKISHKFPHVKTEEWGWEKMQRSQTQSGTGKVHRLRVEACEQEIRVQFYEFLWSKVSQDQGRWTYLRVVHRTVEELPTLYVTACDLFHFSSVVDFIALPVIQVHRCMRTSSIEYYTILSNIQNTILINTPNIMSSTTIIKQSTMITASLRII